MFQIIPFLVQWLALTYVAQHGQQSYPISKKSHWALIEDLRSISEDEVEKFLPQLCNILVDRDQSTGGGDEFGIYQNLERVLMDKCAKCFPFGVRVCNLLTAAAYSAAAERKPWGSLGSEGSIDKEERIRHLQSIAEAATANGYNLPQRYSYLRSSYYRDFRFMLDSFSRLGEELKAYPIQQRNHHLREAVRDINGLIFNRMLSRGQGSQQNKNSADYYSASMMSGTAGLQPEQVALGCPDAAEYSMHFPMQHCDDTCLRVLQFVADECESLPSASKAPYLLTVECLEQSFSCQHEKLYTQGHKVGTTIIDTIHSRRLSNVPPRPPPGPPAATLHALKLPEEACHQASDLVACLQSRAQQPVLDDDLSHKMNENVKIFGRTDAVPPAEVVGGGDGQKDPIGIDGAIDKQILKERLNTAVDHNIRGGSYNYNPKGTQEHSHSIEQRFAYKNNEQQQGAGYYSSQGYPSATAAVAGDEYYPSTSSSRPKVFVSDKTWLERRSIVQRNSAFGHLPGWTLKSFIVKSGDDVRKEMLAMQLVELFQRIFQADGLDIILKPYQIISTGHASGLIEFVHDAISIDGIRKCSPDSPMSLKDYFQYGLGFGPSYSPSFTKGLQNFVKSLVGYSLVTYLLQLRDRHNANIMIGTDGSIIHIDFGFIFGESPGFNIKFENAPFKLTKEYVDLMGGVDSSTFKMFEELFVRGFMSLQKHSEAVVALVELFYGSKKRSASEELRNRFKFMKSHADIVSLIRESLDNWRTKQYDWFQQKTNNILM